MFGSRWSIGTSINEELDRTVKVMLTANPNVPVLSEFVMETSNDLCKKLMDTEMEMVMRVMPLHQLKNFQNLILSEISQREHEYRQMDKGTNE